MPRLTPIEQVNEKVGLWKQAYTMLREDMTNPEMRLILATLQSDEDMRNLPLYIQLARLISANDRAAGTIAALLTATGIKPQSINYGDDE